MATVTDVEVANASFPTVRQDLNDILEAIATNFSADAEPTTTYANQWWYETDTNKLYIRNEDNDAWIHVLTLDQTTDTIASVEGAGGDKIEEGNSFVEVIDTGTGYVQINVDGAEVARLDATGLGVGVVSPTATLDVNGTIKLDGNHPVGSGNVAFGDQALDDGSLSGGNNTAIGYLSMSANTTGNNNVAMGAASLDANISGAGNVAIGVSALGANTASYNTSVGLNSSEHNTTGSFNDAFGWSALNLNTTGGSNVALGNRALAANTTASNNTAVGVVALTANTTGAQNTAVGALALDANTTASNNTAIGYSSLSANGTGASNVAIGVNALLNSGGDNNTVVGTFAGDAITSGNENSILGVAALTNATSGRNNVAIGQQAGVDITTGTYNTCVGASNAGDNLTTGSFNTYLGYFPNASSGSVSGALAIGAGNIGVTDKGSNTGFINPGNGGVYQGNNSSSWSTTSDQRLKKNIADNNDGLDKINSITVRNFEYRTEDEVTDLDPSNAIDIEGVQLGVIAQEIQQVCPEMVKEESTGVLSVDTDNLVWYLVNAVKELSAKVEALENQ